MKPPVACILVELMGQFPSALISGQRQVGKSTLLKHIAGEDFSYLTFDDPLLVKRVKEDPHLFMLDHPGKLILDETCQRIHGRSNRNPSSCWF